MATRPNCRHYFIPITIKQALGNITELKIIQRRRITNHNNKERRIRYWKDNKELSIVWAVKECNSIKSN